MDFSPLSMILFYCKLKKRLAPKKLLLRSTCRVSQTWIWFWCLAAPLKTSGLNNRLTDVKCPLPGTSNAQIKSDWLNTTMRTRWQDKELVLDFYQDRTSFGSRESFERATESKRARNSWLTAQKWLQGSWKTWKIRERLSSLDKDRKN